MNDITQDEMFALIGELYASTKKLVQRVAQLEQEKSHLEEMLSPSNGQVVDAIRIPTESK